MRGVVIQSTRKASLVTVICTAKKPGTQFFSSWKIFFHFTPKVFAWNLFAVVKQSFLSLQDCFFSAFFYFFAPRFSRGCAEYVFCQLGRHMAGGATDRRSSKLQLAQFAPFYFYKCTFVARPAGTLAALKYFTHGMTLKWNHLFLCSSKHVIVLCAPWY